MEEPIPQCVQFQILYACGGKACTGPHVVPLENLVQHNTVKKSANAKPKPYTSGCWKSPRVLLACRAGTNALNSLALIVGHFDTYLSAVRVYLRWVQVRVYNARNLHR